MKGETDTEHKLEKLVTPENITNSEKVIQCTQILISSRSNDSFNIQCDCIIKQHE